MTAQVQAGSLFSGARGVWVFGNAGISARENFKMRNGAIQSSGGPRGCSQEIDGLRYHRQKKKRAWSRACSQCGCTVRAVYLGKDMLPARHSRLLLGPARLGT